MFFLILISIVRWIEWDPYNEFEKRRIRMARHLSKILSSQQSSIIDTPDEPQKGDVLRTEAVYRDTDEHMMQAQSEYSNSVIRNQRKRLFKFSRQDEAPPSGPSSIR